MPEALLKITVVTVCFNAVKTLGRSISSVGKQTHPNIEHILVDGGSQDGTMDLVAQSGAHLAHVISEPDKGIYDAMNKGLALATGDVVAFLNADDFYASPEILSEVAECMQSERLDILRGNVAFFRLGKEERIVRVYDSGHFDPKKLANGWMPAHPALFVRRELLDGVGGFKTDYKIAGDFELIARICANANPKFGHLAKVLVKMQTGGISTSGWRARWLINKEILRACRENGIKTNMFKILLRYPRKLTELCWY